MKRFVFCLLVILFGCLVGGCSHKAIPTKEIVTETVYKDRVVNVVNPADSGRLVALLRCDSANNVIMDELSLALTDKMLADVSLDSVGRLLANFRTQVDTIRVVVTDTIIKQSDKRIEVVEVERKLNGWQRFCLWFTPAILGAGCIYLYNRRRDL
jgi:hypothetical protein